MDLFSGHIIPISVSIPKGLSDAYADYWELNRNHTLINYNHCVENPGKFKDTELIAGTYSQLFRTGLQRPHAFK